MFFFRFIINIALLLWSSRLKAGRAEELFWERGRGTKHSALPNKAKEHTLYVMNGIMTYFSVKCPEVASYICHPGGGSLRKTGEPQHIQGWEPPRSVPKR